MYFVCTVRDLIQKMDGCGVASSQSTHADSEGGVFGRVRALMEMCGHKEDSGDYAAALVHCQQAIGT